MAQKKSSLAQSVAVFGSDSAYHSSSSFNLPQELDRIINQVPIVHEPIAQTHKFLPNLRLKKNSMVQAQKAIKLIRQGKSMPEAAKKRENRESSYESN